MKKTLLMFFIMVSLSGCYMAPLAFMGPVTSGFSTVSIVQSAVTTTASNVIKKNTGKSINEHILDVLKDESNYRHTLLRSN